ncbi:MAG: hypothetical protein J5602_14160 [Clostridia bacterium]|nr:hypothetical protein [Clostridia bacterium]
MKKFALLLLALTIALSALGALADQYPGAEPWKIYMLDSGAVNDFDGDGDEEAFSFSMTGDADSWDGQFTITVDGLSISQGNCCELCGEVYVLHIGWLGYASRDDGYYASLFIVPEYGPSDDPYSYCYLYEDGELIEVGGLPALPHNMSADPSTGMISVQIRADMVGTWSRPADYILATGYSWGEDYENFQRYRHLAEVPRPIYPMGMIVTLKRELPLMASQTDRVFSANLAPDQQVILAATDDVRWLYVTSLDGQTRGWVKMTRVEWQTKIAVGDIDVNIDDVFGDILYAD